MNGAFVETHAVMEILKSWWFQAFEAPLYFYRDKDGTEIDLLIEKDQTLFPIEIKSAASVRRSWAKTFQTLDRLGLRRGPGAVICFADQSQPLAENVVTVPIGEI